MSNSNANFNGTTVIEESGGDIVFVNFNYRVGALGFLASEEVRANGDLNAGLLDQRKALEWVRKYVRQVWTKKEETCPIITIVRPANMSIVWRKSRPCRSPRCLSRRRLSRHPHVRLRRPQRQSIRRRSG